MKAQLQKFGNALGDMVMPNIGAFIAWGLIMALFIPNGWFPNENLAKLGQPMMTYLLPILIGYTGGKMISGLRGGVTGAIATVGVIVGTSVPMFIGAMVMGPLGGWCIKMFDKWTDGKIGKAFVMLVDNFSVGIIAMILAILGYLFIGGAVEWLTNIFKVAVQFLINHKLLPLVSTIVEPAKVMFLNNAINHGIFDVLGVQQVEEIGNSIIFLIETNPGPGLGVLLAAWAFGRGNLKQSAPGAIIIQFLGGIHEIYFPFVLSQPLMIIAPILGSSAALTFFSLTGTGLMAPAAPGSIFALLALAPKGRTLTVLAGVLIAAAVSFLVAAPFFKFGNKQKDAPAAADTSASATQAE